MRTTEEEERVPGDEAGRRSAMRAGARLWRSTWRWRRRLWRRWAEAAAAAGTKASAPVTTMAAVLAGSGDGGSPHPDLRQRREERAFPLHVPLRREPAVPAGGRVGFRCSRNSLSREACAGEKGGAAAGRREKLGFGLRGAFRKRRLRLRVDYGKIEEPFCKKGRGHLATSRSVRSRKCGRARRTNLSLRNPMQKLDVYMSGLFFFR